MECRRQVQNLDLMNLVHNVQLQKMRLAENCVQFLLKIFFSKTGWGGGISEYPHMNRVRKCFSKASLLGSN